MNICDLGSAISAVPVSASTVRRLRRQRRRPTGLIAVKNGEPLTIVKMAMRQGDTLRIEYVPMETTMDDRELRQMVIDELDFDPSIDSSNIGVAVTGGVVTLTGHVGSYAEKMATEKAVKRVKGVQAVAQEIEIRYPEDKKLADDQIAKRALDILAWNVQLPAGTLQVTVSGGWVKLSGEVDWYYQKLLAEASVRKLSGVTGISNMIRIVGGAQSADVKQRIEYALKRSAELEARSIHVDVANGKVTLNGTVRAWNERQLAERAAWAIPGVHEVEDNLRVS